MIDLVNAQLISCVDVCDWLSVDYFDDLASGGQQAGVDQTAVSGLPLPAVAVKNLHLSGVKAYCDEFPSTATVSRSTSHFSTSPSVSWFHARCTYVAMSLAWFS